MHLPRTIKDLREISSILDFLETVRLKKAASDAEQSDALPLLKHLVDKYIDCDLLSQFIKDQISLSNVQKNQRRYPSNLMVFAALLNSISPHAYRFLRNSGSVILPHPTTIRQLTSNLNINPAEEQHDASFLKFITEKFKQLKSEENVVVVTMDEIHIKPYFEYKGGNLIGMAYDSEHAATSAHTFMVQSILSDFKEVVHILPVKTISAEKLHIILKKIILGLEEIGFCVIAVSSDNNSINRKTMSLFVDPPNLQTQYPHPANPDRPLFYVIDVVHIFKCIRNNWLNQKNPGQCMFFPNFKDINNFVIKELETASFGTLKKLHELEYVNLVKFGHGLTLKSLNPTNIERQNVKLVLNIFNEFVIEALNTLGEKHALPHFQGTAMFIEIILKWWWVVNVKTPNKGNRLKNSFMYPLIDAENDERVSFLKDFLQWLDIW
ncbi:uncharacterized protein LOC129217416 [Uloborus diversus]|uniref:uncharacterized protein LOC129217416 n=1 Tax=Uloborus diversus TaxID=327109 RepID=UPI002409DBE9|nr:uncharacterized protein LOC129217416 [Uloborus diversus]